MPSEARRAKDGLLPFTAQLRMARHFPNADARKRRMPSEARRAKDGLLPFTAQLRMARPVLSPFLSNDVLRLFASKHV
jgi:hypothetical protein